MKKTVLLTIASMALLTASIFVFSSCEETPDPRGLSVDEYETTDEATACTTDRIDLFFNNPAKGDTSIGDGLVELIEKQDSGDMYVCLYGFDYEPVIEALKDAMSRGVAVHFLGDTDYYAEDAGYKEIETYIDTEDNGGSFTTIYEGSEHMHNKFVLVVDSETERQYVWTGSTNVTDNGVLSNNNNALIIESAALYSEYKKQFEYLRGDAGSEAVSGVKEISLDCNITLKLMFSYKNSGRESTALPLNKVVEAISEATSSMYFMMFTFTSYDIFNEIAGLDFETESANQGIFDTYQQSSNDNAFTTLDADDSVEVLYDGNSALLHHKVGIIDKDSVDACVITGSMNWTKAGSETNAENILFIYSYQIAQSYYTEFQKCWEEAEKNSRKREQ